MLLQVLDFGASRDGAPTADLGRRIVVDHCGREIDDVVAAVAADDEV